MKIKKDTILQGFLILNKVYADFAKRIENKNEMREMINTWIEIFKTIDFDYEYANDDFIEATKSISSKSKYIPTIAEISEEMKHIYNKRITKEENNKKTKIWRIEENCDLRSGNIDKVIDIYNRLTEKYNDNEIIELIHNYKKEKNLISAILETENTFKEIMEINNE